MRLLALAATVAWLASPAMAASQKEMQTCAANVDHDQAIAACSRLIADPSFDQRSLAFYNRGNAWSSKDEYDRAIADFDEAIRLDPTNFASFNNRASALASKGELDRAIADFDQAIRLNPTEVRSYNSRGNAYFDKDDLERAVADYDAAIRLNPNYASPYDNRSRVWTRTGKYDRAIADLDEAIRINPKDRSAYANRGTNWRLKGDLDRALADQDMAVELATNRKGFTLVERGTTFRYRGEFSRAIADFEQALRSYPAFIPALTGLGLTYEKMGDLAKARISFQQALDSQSPYRFDGYSHPAAETARARLAALDSGVAQPSIPVSLPKATSPTAIPTPAVPVATAAAANVKTTAAREGRRVALVIGNSTYVNVPALPNPQRDAKAITASLRNIGFDSVTLANNSTREKLIDSLRAFANEAENADWAMVYYAGHGMEVGGMNYLVPIEAKLAVDRDIQFEAVPLDQVLAAVDSARKLKLVVLDACRDNPFATRQTAAPGPVASTPTEGRTIASRSIGRGLAEVKASSGTLVVFAAKNGQVALDGEGDNSPFAVAVLQRIGTPGVEINKLFRLVRDDVMEATAGRQEPYTYGSLPGREDFFFVEK